MSKDALRTQHAAFLQCAGQPGQFPAGMRAQSIHARFQLYMHAGLLPRLQGRLLHLSKLPFLIESKNYIIFNGFFQAALKCRPHAENGLIYAGFAQRDAFFYGRHSKIIRTRAGKRKRNRQKPMPIGIGFDHSHEHGLPHMALNCVIIMYQFIQVYICHSRSHIFPSSRPQKKICK